MITFLSSISTTPRLSLAVRRKTAGADPGFSSGPGCRAQSSSQLGGGGGVQPLKQKIIIFEGTPKQE